MTDARVKTLSLDDYKNPALRKFFIDELHSSLREFGFVGIRNHGIDETLLSDSYELNRALFQLSDAQKQSYSQAELGHRGYTAFGQERAKDNPQPDLKEFWHIGPELNDESAYFMRYPPNVWPHELAQFKAVMLSLYNQLNDVASLVLEAIGLALKIPPTYFADLIHDGNSVLRLIHYPPVAGMNTAQQMRAAPHADINLMTLLVGASDSGLELLDQDGQWLAINSEPGEIIIDTGDMMALITNSRLPATVHRVVNPDSESKARYSMPFFVHPHSDAELQCLAQFRKPDEEYQSISAGDFLQQRLRENGLVK